VVEIQRVKNEHIIKKYLPKHDVPLLVLLVSLPDVENFQWRSPARSQYGHREGPKCKL